MNERDRGTRGVPPLQIIHIVTVIFCMNSTCHCVYSCLFDVKSKILLDLASSGCQLKKKIGWEFYYFVYGFNIKGSNPRWPPVLKMYNLHILCRLKWIAANVLPISMQL